MGYGAQERLLCVARGVAGEGDGSQADRNRPRHRECVEIDDHDHAARAGHPEFVAENGQLPWDAGTDTDAKLSDFAATREAVDIDLAFAIADEHLVFGRGQHEAFRTLLRPGEAEIHHLRLPGCRVHDGDVLVARIGHVDLAGRRMNIERHRHRADTECLLHRISRGIHDGQNTRRADRVGRIAANDDAAESANDIQLPCRDRRVLQAHGEHRLRCEGVIRPLKSRQMRRTVPAAQTVLRNADRQATAHGETDVCTDELHPANLMCRTRNRVELDERLQRVGRHVNDIELVTGRASEVSLECRRVNRDVDDCIDARNCRKVDRLHTARGHVHDCHGIAAIDCRNISHVELRVHDNGRCRTESHRDGQTLVTRHVGRCRQSCRDHGVDRKGRSHGERHLLGRATAGNRSRHAGDLNGSAVHAIAGQVLVIRRLDLRGRNDTSRAVRRRDAEHLRRSRVRRRIGDRRR